MCIRGRKGATTEKRLNHKVSKAEEEDVRMWRFQNGWRRSERQGVREITKGFINEKEDLELNMVLYREPVKILEYRCNMVSGSGVGKKLEACRGMWS